MRLSIIIPVYNEEQTVGKVIKEINEIKIAGVEKEVIVVNDGSTDKTDTVITSTQLDIPALKYINHHKNLGKGAAIASGIKIATGNYILVQDADLEYNPHFINELLSPIIREQAQVVYGTRLNRLPHLQKEERRPRFLLHYFGNRMLSLLTSLLYGQWLTDMETGYKVFPKKVVEDMKLQARSFDFEPEITAKLLKKGYRILEIPITTTPRGYEKGKKLNTLRDGIKALWTLLKFRFIN